VTRAASDRDVAIAMERRRIRVDAARGKLPGVSGF